MKFYIDSEYRCHATNPDGFYHEKEHQFFDGKCTTFVEGYCYDDSEGCVRIYPWEPYSELDAAQREYEKQRLNEYNLILQELGVEI